MPHTQRPERLWRVGTCVCNRCRRAFERACSQPCTRPLHPGLHYAPQPGRESSATASDENKRPGSPVFEACSIGILLPQIVSVLLFRWQVPQSVQ